MDENANYNENFDPDMEVFIYNFKKLDIMNDYDIFEEYTSETYGVINVSLSLGLTNSQTNLNPQEKFQPSEQPEQQPFEPEHQPIEQPFEPEQQPIEQPFEQPQEHANEPEQ